MSSLTISITEWREDQPCSATEGLSTRTLGCPGRRVAPNCQCESSAPQRSGTVRSA
jgi:hypothetical protein